MRSLNLVRLAVAPLAFAFMLFSNIALAGPSHCAKSKDAVACGKAKGCLWSGTACTSKKAAAKKAPVKAAAAAKKEVAPAAPEPAAEEETGAEMEESEEL
jgi:hypothetical protein